MPKILITGNGFDLNSNLPTSYNDFIKILSKLEETTNYEFDNIYSVCTNYSNIKQKFKSFDFDKVKIEEIKEKIGQNLWYNFFKNEFEIETWIDFESKIDYVLKNLYNSIDIIKKNIFSNSTIKELETYNTGLFYDNIEIIEILKNFNLIKVNTVDEVTFNEEIFSKKHHNYINVNVNFITKKLITELDKFKIIFNLHFETFIHPLYDNLINKEQNNLFNNITEHFTFNYTPTFEKFFNSKIKTNYLHGKIDSKKIVLY